MSLQLFNVFDLLGVSSYQFISEGDESKSLQLERPP